MELDEYQVRAAEYDFPCSTKGVLWFYALGLCGEAGELGDKVKKLYRDGASLDDSVKKEIGDVLWYVAALSRHLGFKLSEIAVANLVKLSDRAARGALGGSGDDR